MATERGNVEELVKTWKIETVADGIVVTFNGKSFRLGGSTAAFAFDTQRAAQGLNGLYEGQNTSPADEVLLLLPITEKRPEEIRVMKIEEFFVVQTKRPGQTDWITQSERTEIDRAKQEALDWYPS